MESLTTRKEEEKRLTDLGIPYKQIMLLDEGIVVIVENDVLEKIIRMRESGKMVEGKFISMSCGSWSGSFLDEYDDHHFIRGLSERLVYRFVLGYEIGRKPQTSRFKGYNPLKRRTKDVL